MKLQLFICITLWVFSCNSNGGGKKESTAIADSNTKVPFRVMVLPTADGMQEDTTPVVFNYPDTVLIDSASEWRNDLAVFGVSYKIWTGIKGWTGTGAVGVDGNIAVRLVPAGNDSMQGAYISYCEVPACVGCILEDAAKYFPEARKEYITEYNGDSADIVLPKGTIVTHLSPTLVTYTMPSVNGLCIKGVSKYTGPEDYYSAKFVLPVQNQRLSDFLVGCYIRQIGGQ